jgi:Fic family protein
MKPAIAEKLPIKTLDWAALVPVLGEANRAVARFDGMMAHLRNPALLRTPLTTREAVLSSKIEGTVATISDVLRYEAGDEQESERKRLDIEEIVNYRAALRGAERELKTRPFSLNLVLKLHKILLTSVRGHNKAPGEWRRSQNYLGRPGSTIAEATFVPPSPARLMDGLDNWEKYYHAAEKDPLVQLALIHAQFEFLHPFLDGNGRIGRILIPLFLYDKKILSSPSFYLSEYFEEHRDEYIERLGELSSGGKAWDRWCLFFVKAVTAQADNNVARVTAVLKLYDRLKVRMMDMTTSRYGVTMLDAIFTQPVFKAGGLLRSPGMPQRPQMMKLLEKMVEARILKVLVEGSGRRAAVYSLHELVRICDSQTAPGNRTVKTGVTLSDSQS